MNGKDLFNEFKDFVEKREPNAINFEDLAQIDLINANFQKANIYIKNLKEYLECDEYKLLLFNLLLHFCCVDDNFPLLYEKYDISNKEVIVSSASNSGSSSTIQTFRSLQDGEFLMIDLYRTRYGKFAYSILESLKGIAIVRL